MKLKPILMMLATVFAVAANAVQPAFNATEPAGAQRGTEVTVTFTGERLEDTEQVMFFEKGIEVLEILSATNRSVKAKLRIAPDCRVGEHNLRLRTSGGVSPLRIFYVGVLPGSDEKEPNSERAKAQKITMNSTINGRVDTEDVDYYTVEVNKGQRLAVEVEGARLGRTMFDSYLSVRDPQGKLIAESDDTALLVQDSYVSLIAPETGAYLIEVRDSSYSGSGHVYRLHVGSFPRPATVYPLGGEIGSKVKARFIGDASGEFDQEIQLPSEPSDRFTVVANREGLASSPNWMRVSPFPNALENEPNDAITNASVAAKLPVALNGVLSRKGDVDYFKITARKDQTLEINAWARRLGSPVDSVVQVFNNKGGSLSSNDDSGGNPDSSIRFKAPADGDYYVKVSDQLGRGGPDFTYRVEITEPLPVVALSIPDTARYDYETRKSIVVPQGNRFAILMNVARDNVDGAMQLEFPGLPKGMSVATDTVSNGVAAQVVVFEAANDAPVAGALLQPRAKSSDPTKLFGNRFRHLVEWVRIQNNTVYTQSEVDQIAAAVTKPVPFKLRVVEPKVPIVQNGSQQWQIIADREAGFDEPIQVKMVWNPPGISSVPDITIPKGTNVALYPVNAAGNASSRVWKTAVVGSARVNGGTAYVSSQLVPIEIAPAFVEGKIDLTVIERGKPGKVTCKLTQKVPFEGKATVELVGLPANTSAKPVEVTKDSTEAVFEIVTTEKTQPGLTKNLFCKLVITRNGEPITHSIAQGGLLRIDAPRVKLADAKTTAK